MSSTSLRDSVLKYIEHGADGPIQELREAQVIAMMRWSEEHFCAGWMHNLPWRLWQAAEWDAQARRIVELAEVTGVWMLSEGTSVPIDEWRRNPINEDD